MKMKQCDNAKCGESFEEDHQVILQQFCPRCRHVARQALWVGVSGVGGIAILFVLILYILK